MSRVVYLLISTVFMILVISKVKKKRFFEKESFVWLVGAVIMFVLSMFPQIIPQLSKIVGIDYPPSLLFLVAIVFVLFLLFKKSEEVSLLKEEAKELGQRVVVLEKIINENYKGKEINNEKRDDE